MSFYNDIKQAEVAISKDPDNGIQAEFNFSEELELFKGHFPGSPILPGVAQIEMVRFALEKVFSKKVSIKTIRKTKFSHLVRPLETVAVKINILPEKPEDFNVVSTRVTVLCGDNVAGKLNLTLVLDD